MNTSYSKRRHIQEANNRLEERMLNEQEVKVGDTINLYSLPLENNSNFLTQATIKGFLDDVNIPETQYKRKTYPGRIEKVISITAPNYNDAILRFSCPSNLNDSDFDLRWNSGPAHSNSQIVYNKNLSKAMIKQFCETKGDPNNLLRKTSVPKATFSSTEPVSSSMAEGKKVTKIIRLVENDLTRLVGKIVKEQQNQGMGLKDESEKTISMEQWLRTLGVNGRASGDFWSYSQGFSSGGLLTLKSSDGKTVKIKL
jgi:hypothetical protein